MVAVLEAVELPMESAELSYLMEMEVAEEAADLSNLMEVEAAEEAAAEEEKEVDMMAEVVEVEVVEVVEVKESSNQLVIGTRHRMQGY